MGRHHQLMHPERELSFRHELAEPSPTPLPFTPRAHIIPRQRGLTPVVPAPRHALPETRRTGIHRAPRPTVIEWLGTRAARWTTVATLGASVSMFGGSSWLEASMDKQIAYNTTLDDIVLGEANAKEVINEIIPRITPKNPPRVTPPTKASPTTATKKPAPTIVDNWPAPGTNCNYLPKHQHKASVTSAIQAKAIFKKMVIACFGAKEWPAAEQLWQHESNFRPMARNPHGGACGVVQSLPCSKLLRASNASSLGNTTVEKQALWGVRYVKAAYGTPTRAWRHWRASVNINGREVGHWY